MSLNLAKAYKSGILISTQKSHTLIVPTKLTIALNHSKNKQFQERINRQTFYYFHKNISRYTYQFRRDSNNKPFLQVNLYFQSNTSGNLAIKAKQTIQSINRYLQSNGIELTIIEPETYLKSIVASKPSRISATTNNIFKLTTNNDSFLISCLCLEIKDKQSGNDLVTFLQDFYSHLDIGELYLDVINSSRNDKSKLKTQAAVIILLKTKDLNSLKKNLGRLNNLLKLLYLDVLSSESAKYWFVSLNELQENFGKILMGQGWKYSEIEQTSWLNFAEYFNILQNYK